MIQMPIAQGAATPGIPLPYTPRMDDGIAILLLGCFFLSAYVFSRNHKFLLQLVKDFLLHRQRTSIFAMSAAADMRYLLLLVFQTSILVGLCFFEYSISVYPKLLLHTAPMALLGIYAGAYLFYLLLKWLVYSLLGWVFFDQNKTSMWLSSYSTLLYYFGFSLFPVVLLMVYFDIDVQISSIIGLILLFLAKILIFYKWIKLFCNKLHGILLLILYFCALEIMPCLIWYQGMMQLNSFLQ